jgi:hypothetical protein
MAGNTNLRLDRKEIKLRLINQSAMIREHQEK